MSARGELHAADLPAATAVRLALAGLAETAELSPEELTARVRARFPQLGALPARPELDAVVESAGLGLRFDEDVYRSAHAARSVTTGLPSRASTSVPAPSEATVSRGDYLGSTLAESRMIPSAQDSGEVRWPWDASRSPGPAPKQATGKSGEEEGATVPTPAPGHHPRRSPPAIRDLRSTEGMSVETGQRR